jgi:hypothetical protein
MPFCDTCSGVRENQVFEERNARLLLFPAICDVFLVIATASFSS